MSLSFRILTSIPHIINHELLFINPHLCLESSQLRMSCCILASKCSSLPKILANDESARTISKTTKPPSLQYETLTVLMSVDVPFELTLPTQILSWKGKQP